MAYNRIQAARLLNVRELEVFEASLSDRLGTLSERGLTTMIGRARTLRDKAQDLLQRQRVATRGRTGSKAGASGHENERSQQKAKALGEMLQRFETRLKQVEAAKERAERKSASAQLREALQKKRGATVPAKRSAAAKRSPKAPAAGPRASGKPDAGGSESARETRHAKAFQEAGLSSVQGHVSSGVRRSQAKRDSRG